LIIKIVGALRKVARKLSLKILAVLIKIAGNDLKENLEWNFMFLWCIQLLLNTRKVTFSNWSWDPNKTWLDSWKLDEL